MGQHRRPARIERVIVYVMDVSGSMTDEQKTLVRTEAFWIDTWLRSQYDGVEIRFIIHDAVAKEVDEETFYHTRESGGTRISSAYKVARDLLAREFPRRTGTFTSSSSRMATIGERTIRFAWNCFARPSAAGVQRLLLWPGGQPLRDRRIPEGAPQTGG